MRDKLKDLDNRMYNLNANLSALIHIQKIKSKEEAEAFLSRINREISQWIRVVRIMHEELDALCVKDVDVLEDETDE